MSTSSPVRPLAAVLAVMALIGLTLGLDIQRASATTPYRLGGPVTLTTDLLSASGLSAWAIDYELEATTPWRGLGASFMAAERTYGINARFMIAVALHESGWGSSYLAINKHNLFGFNAYDRDPYGSASSFQTYAEGIDAWAKFMKAAYLTPGGRYWGGSPTLMAIQSRYSSSGAWGTSISRFASSLSFESLQSLAVAIKAPVRTTHLVAASQASLALAWTGNLPERLTYQVSWSPVWLEDDLRAAPAAVSTVSARLRVNAANQSGELTVATPTMPGDYLVTVVPRDRDGAALLGLDRIAVPTIEIRVYGDYGVTYEVEPFADASGAAVTVTNVGRLPIPAIGGSFVSATDTTIVRDQSALIQARVFGSSPQTGSSGTVILNTALPESLAPGASLTVIIPNPASIIGTGRGYFLVELVPPDHRVRFINQPPLGFWYPSPPPVPDPSTSPSVNVGAGAGGLTTRP